jgi:DNA-binding transcriptional LysR family regulator
LLRRDGRRRRLTEAGEAVAAYARRVIGESETLANHLEMRRSGGIGTLRVGLIDAAALYLFREPLAEFRAAHPEAAVAITVAGSAELEQRLFDFEDEIAVVVGPAGRGVSLPLLDELMNLYGAGEVASGATFALYPRGSRTRRAIDAGLAAAGIDPLVTAESGNPAVLRELCRLTGSFTVLPEDVAAESHRLEVLHEGIATRAVELVVRESDGLTPLAAAFVKRLTG